MRSEKSQNHTVSALVLLLNLRVLEIGTGGHPTMNLTWVSLSMLGDLEVLDVSLDRDRIFILGCQQRHGHRNVASVVGVEPGWVSLDSGLEGNAVLANSQVSDLSAPAITQDAPFREAIATRCQLVGICYDTRDEGQGCKLLSTINHRHHFLLVLGNGRQMNTIYLQKQHLT